MTESTTSPIRVILADDQALIRGGFRALIDSAPDLVVVGEAEDGQAAIDLLRSERADVVLMDIRMPGLDGLAATQAICADDDLAGVKVIVLTTFELDDYVIQAVQAGVSGFLGQGVEPTEVLHASGRSSVATPCSHEGDQGVAPTVSQLGCVCLDLRTLECLTNQNPR